MTKNHVEHYLFMDFVRNINHNFLLFQLNFVVNIIMFRQKKNM